eukprot:scaffold1105_cov184-Ochromonas_danica.AAC.2
MSGLSAQFSVRDHVGGYRDKMVKDGDSSMSIFQVFPTVLLHEILMHWISTKDLLHLDSALCNKIDRSEYLTILSTTFFRTQGLFLTQSTGLSAFQWLLKRQTRVTNLTVMDQRDIRNNDTDRYRDRDHYTFNTSNNVMNLSNTMLQSIGQRCPSLRSLDLRGSKSVTDSGLLTIHKCKMLKEIDLSDCLQITSEAILALLVACPNLHSIALARIPQVTDDLLFGIARDAQLYDRLTKIDISECKHITDVGFVRLAFACSQLSNLTVNYCPLLTSVYLEKVKQECTQISLLSALHF